MPIVGNNGTESIFSPQESDAHTQRIGYMTLMSDLNEVNIQQAESLRSCDVSYLNPQDDLDASDAGGCIGQADSEATSARPTIIPPVNAQRPVIDSSMSALITAARPVENIASIPSTPAQPQTRTSALPRLVTSLANICSDIAPVDNKLESLTEGNRKRNNRN